MTSSSQPRRRNRLGIPENVLAAARAAGLRYPHGWVGRTARARPRKHTVASVIEEVKRRGQ